MKIKTFVIVVVAIVALTGCRDRNDPQTKANNWVNANTPEFVVDTPKGKLFRIWIDMGSGKHPDRIYFFENATNNTISVNKTISNGKSSHVETTVVIDGVEYIRK